MYETTFIAHPDFIHFFVLTGHHTLNDEVTACFGFTSYIQCNVAPHWALCTNRSDLSHFPRARLETEVSGGQRADRANIRSVARKNGIKSGVREGDDLHGAST